MDPPWRLPWWPALLLALLGLGTLYWGALQTGFLNDDFLFLEDVRGRALAESLSQLGALSNYYRPLSRQVYFATLTPFAGETAWVFHLANAVVFTVALALLLDLLLAILPLQGALAGTLYFATLPLQRVNLTWISCSQDLLALTFALAALALFRRRRDGWACLSYLAALASKEIAFPLPLALAAWAWWMGEPEASGSRARPTVRALARRLAPFAAVAAVWVGVLLAVGAPHAATRGFLRIGLGQFLAAWVHAIQSLLGIEHPEGLARSLALHGPDLLPLALLAALAIWLDAPPPAAEPPYGTRSHRSVVGIAVTWITVFALPIGPIAHVWSSYYYTLAAVGGALLVGLVLARIDRWGWPVLVALLLWWHAGSSGTRAFAIANQPWGWTSHLTAFYFERGAALCDTMGRQLRALEPSPAHGTRFFFATLPPQAGFQMGNGPLIRTLYQDTSLAGYFYSQFSESNAADRPCRFLYWDGVRIAPLYAGAREPWFQFASDLLLFDRPAGAVHAIRRGLAAGEARPDHLYWLGWAELWRGRRDAAEAAWQAFGARDDPARYDAAMRAARDHLLAGDTLAARRTLFEAIRAGVGRPDAHGALGELLEGRQLKYALLELKVAAFLNPRDLRARHHLIRGLVEVRLDDAARAALDALARFEPGWAGDRELVKAQRTLDERSSASRVLVEF